MSLFQQSSLTFGSAKQFIAEQASKQQTTEMKDRAGRSLQAAIKAWNRYNWTWLQTTASLVFASSGTASLPYDFREAYDLTWTGSNARWIPARARRTGTRLYSQNTSWADVPTRYDTFLRGGFGIISVSGASASAGTATLGYYRKMAEPCAVSFTGARVAATGLNYLLSTATDAFANAKPGNIIVPSAGWATASAISTVTAITQAIDPGAASGLVALAYLNTSASASATGISGSIGADTHFLDIPADYEWDIMALAVFHFLGGVGGGGDKLQQWEQLAANGLQRAMSDDSSEEDLDVAFLPPLVDPEYRPWNPNRTYE